MESVSTQLAEEIGLNSAEFEQGLVSNEINDILISEIRQARGMNINSYPSLILEIGAGIAAIAIYYNNPFSMLDVINAVSHGNWLNRHN